MRNMSGELLQIFLFCVVLVSRMKIQNATSGTVFSRRMERTPGNDPMTRASSKGNRWIGFRDGVAGEADKG
jgi:hypothetical protein